MYLNTTGKKKENLPSTLAELFMPIIVRWNQCMDLHITGKESYVNETEMQSKERILATSGNSRKTLIHELLANK